jgi:hypothetical protein
VISAQRGFVFQSTPKSAGCPLPPFDIYLVLLCLITASEYTKMLASPARTPEHRIILT